MADNEKYIELLWHGKYNKIGQCQILVDFFHTS